MGLRPTEGDEKRLGPATTFYGTVALSFCHPERSRGICGSADLSWKCFSNRELTSNSNECPPTRHPGSMTGTELIAGESHFTAQGLFQSG
jgi:hypothetical protein